MELCKEQFWNGKIVNLTGQDVRILMRQSPVVTKGKDREKELMAVGEGIGTSVRRNARTQGRSLAFSRVRAESLIDPVTTFPTSDKALFSREQAARLMDGGFASKVIQLPREPLGYLNEVFALQLPDEVTEDELNELMDRDMMPVSERQIDQAMEQCRGSLLERAFDETYFIVPRLLVVKAVFAGWKNAQRMLYPCGWSTKWQCFAAFAPASELKVRRE